MALTEELVIGLNVSTTTFTPTSTRTENVSTTTSSGPTDLYNIISTLTSLVHQSPAPTTNTTINYRTTTTTTASTTALQLDTSTTLTTDKILEAVENSTEEFHHDGSLDAQVAAVCMTLLLVLLLFSVLYSRMWKLREEWSTEQAAISKEDIFTGGPHVNLKQMIQTKLRHLRHLIIRKKRRHSNRQNMAYQRVESQEYSDSDSEDELYVSNHVR